MAVKRWGVHVTGAEAPENVDLGRVLVTIDDLRALVAELTEVKSGEAPEISLAGGVLESPEDLRELSDSELADIELRSDLRPHYPRAHYISEPTWWLMWTLSSSSAWQAWQPCGCSTNHRSRPGRSPSVG
jgi:hypothetical protein